MGTSFVALSDGQESTRLGSMSGRRAQGATVVLLLLLTGVCGAVRLKAEVKRLQNGNHPAHTPKRAEREQIEDLEQQFQKAQLSGDIVMMDKLLSDDYLGINANGELSTKAQQLDHMRNRALVITQLNASDVKIKLIGATAIVTSEVQLEGTLDGNPLRGRYRYTRIYQRLPSGNWKVTSFEATRIRRPNE